MNIPRRLKLNLCDKCGEAHPDGNPCEGGLIRECVYGLIFYANTEAEIEERENRNRIKPHAFVKSHDPRFVNSCQYCGRVPEHELHAEVA